MDHSIYRGGQRVDQDANTRSQRGPPHSSQAASYRGNPPPPPAAIYYHQRHSSEPDHGHIPRSQAASVTSTRSPLTSGNNAQRSINNNGRAGSDGNSDYPQHHGEQSYYYPAPPHGSYIQPNEPQYPPPHVLYDSDIGSTLDDVEYPTNPQSPYASQPNSTRVQSVPSRVVPQLVIPVTRSEEAYYQQQQQHHYREPQYNEEGAYPPQYENQQYQQQEGLLEFDPDVHHQQSSAPCSHRVVPASEAASSVYGGSALDRSVKKGEDTPRLKYSTRVPSLPRNGEPNAYPEHSMNRNSTLSPREMSSQRRGSRSLLQAPALEEAQYGHHNPSSSSTRRDIRSLSTNGGDGDDEEYDTDMLVEKSENGTQTVYHFHKVKRGKGSNSRSLLADPNAGSGEKKRSPSPQSNAPHTVVPNIEPRHGSPTNNNRSSVSSRDRGDGSLNGSVYRPETNPPQPMSKSGRSPSPSHPHASDKKDDENAREDSVTIRRRWRDDDGAVIVAKPEPMPIFVLQRPKAKYGCC